MITSMLLNKLPMLETGKACLYAFGFSNKEVKVGKTSNTTARLKAHLCSRRFEFTEPAWVHVFQPIDDWVCHVAEMEAKDRLSEVFTRRRKTETFACDNKAHFVGIVREAIKNVMSVAKTDFDVLSERASNPANQKRALELATLTNKRAFCRKYGLPPRTLWRLIGGDANPTQSTLRAFDAAIKAEKRKPAAMSAEVAR